ncbi:MAG: ATP-binding cassette domain-containing protein [Magnetospirillum sp.]|nr:ATP-binding cassette domain-containing protein [Magnetospirillum sp.]
MTANAAIALNGLTITTPAGRVLVKDANFALGAGEVVLLVGPSGSGKSTIINALSGLLGCDGDHWRVSGTVHLEGRVHDLAKESCNVGGLVFQNNALFDDLTAGGNAHITADHVGRLDARIAQLIMELLHDVDPDQSVASCSGGQRQRVAIARTLLADRKVLLFDEPNSGLDKMAARRLASLIRQLCHQMGRPALIVAHHVDDLLPLADRVLFLDPTRCKLSELPADRATVESALLGAASDDDMQPEARSFPWKLKPRSRWRWMSHYLGEYFWILCASPLLLGYVVLGAMIVGFVSVWFGFNYDALGSFIRSIVHDDALMGIGFIEMTVVVPLISCLLMVACNNAIITADLGNRALSSQFRAMSNLGIPARRYIFLSIAVNMTIAGLLLTAASMAVASFTSYHVWRLIFIGQPFELWMENFFREFLRSDRALLVHGGWTLFKVVATSVAATTTALAIGATRKESVISINHAIARSIVFGASATLIIHAVVAVLQF